MSLNCSNEFKIFGGIVVWTIKTGELHVLVVALKCEILHALSVHVRGTQQCRASLCAVWSRTSSKRSVTRATCTRCHAGEKVPHMKEKDTKGEVTNNMTQCILPCLFSQKFSVRTRERASQVRAHASQMTVPSLASLLVFGSLLLRHCSRCSCEESCERGESRRVVRGRMATLQDLANQGASSPSMPSLSLSKSCVSSSPSLLVSRSSRSRNSS